MGLHVMGKYVTSTMILILSDNALVGNMEFVKLFLLDLMNWVRDKWKPLNKMVLRVLMLMNDQFCFIFLLVEDQKILIEDRFWVIEYGTLVLLRWHSGFNPWKERLKKMNLWVFLIEFSLHCWNLARFMVVDKAIGHFILIEEYFMLASVIRLPRMLVQVDILEGLPTELEVVWGGGLFVQRLDYWKIPFRCHNC